MWLLPESGAGAVRTWRVVRHCRLDMARGGGARTKLPGVPGERRRAFSGLLTCSGCLAVVPTPGNTPTEYCHRLDGRRFLGRSHRGCRAYRYRRSGRSRVRPPRAPGVGRGRVMTEHILSSDQD